MDGGVHTAGGESGEDVLHLHRIGARVGDFSCARRSFDAATIFMALVICCVFFTARTRRGGGQSVMA